VGHNETNLADALGRSCNVYFFTAARHSGPRPLVDWARKLGFGEPTGIDVPGESAGRLPSPDQNELARGRRWYPGDTLGLVIGQSSLLVTPLQMARLMAAVANGGQLVTPHLAAGTGQVRHDGAISSAAPRADDSFSPDAPRFSRPDPKPIPGLHAETLDAVREGLERVVQDRHGTAYKTVRLPSVKIAGKTGTAEVGGRLPDHAWFAGYVPADEPRVAFVVLIEHGGSGGKVAGPVAREFVKLLLDLGVITGSKELARE
jgi:penicillin-binding protein 2